MTVGEALKMASEHFGRRGLRFPRQDAETLLSLALDRDRVFLFAHPEAPLSEAQERRFVDWMKQRGRHFPLQYIRGEQEFYGRPFLVSRDVLIPRPETETLVEAALAFLKQVNSDPPKALDVGTGSGCIAVTLAVEEPRLRVTAVDISHSALKVARANAERLGCIQRISFVQSDGLAALLRGRAGFDLVISNPPYVAPENCEQVDVSVRRFEPRGAVFAGKGGLEVYEKLFRHGARVLKPQGRMIVELGYDLQGDVASLASRFGWEEQSMSPDLAGVIRCAEFARGTEAEDVTTREV